MTPQFLARVTVFAFGVHMLAGVNRDSRLVRTEKSDPSVHLCFVVLSGGHGTRLWPLSRRNRPKQFLKMADGKSLFEKTLERISSLVGVGTRTAVVASSEYLQHAFRLTGDKVDTFLCEPEARNTAAAMLWSCATLREGKDFAGQDPVIVFLPADHLVSDESSFCGSLSYAVQQAACSSDIVLLGIRPTFPSTSYGYVTVSPATRSISGKDGCLAWHVRKVGKFLEKPTLEVAEKLLFSRCGPPCEFCSHGHKVADVDLERYPEVFWNSGVYVGKLSVFLDTARLVAPEVYKPVIDAISGENEFGAIPNLSFDVAVAEKAENLKLVPCDCGWSDVGNLKMFLESQPAIYSGKRVKNIAGRGNLAYSDRPVFFCGVNDLCLVDTGDVMLVVHKDCAELVGDVVGSLGDSEEDADLR